MRPDWDTYFLLIARTVAERADCTRTKHGAVIVDERHHIVSFGYNGAPSGAPGCASAGACPRGRLSKEELASLEGGYDDPKAEGYCIAVHAEANALLQAGSRARGATIYITGEPCHGCKKLIAAAGIEKIIHGKV